MRDTYRQRLKHLAVEIAVGLAVISALSFPSSAQAQQQDPLLRGVKPLFLLQPLDDSTNQLAPSSGITIFFQYFNLGWPWLVGSSAGFAVLQAVYGGFLLMMGGGPEDKYAGKQRILWALAGLLMLGLAGFLLRSLNSMFYQ